MVAPQQTSQLIPIAIYLLAAFLGGVAQYLYKLGARRLSIQPIYQNWPLLLGLLTFISIMVLFILGLKVGDRMSVVYPVYATTFIWGALIAVYVGKEPFSIVQVFGIITIVIGVTLVAVGAPG